MKERRSKLLVLGITIMLLIVMSQGVMASGVDGVVRGRLVLPKGIVAPPEGLEVKVAAESKEYNSNTTSLGQDNVTIPGGENSIEFKIDVDFDLERKDRIIEETGEFIILYAMDYRDRDIYMTNEDIYNRGYYLKDGSSLARIESYTYHSAEVLNFKDGDINIGDFAIVPTTKVSGTISLPNGQLAPEGGIGVSITIVDPDSTPMEPDYDSMVIEEGTNSHGFTIYAPDVDGGIKRYIKYRIFNRDQQVPEYYGYYYTGYYNSEETKANPFNREIIIVGKDNTEGLDLEILELKKLKGKVTLPKGVDFTALNGELEVEAVGMISPHQSLYNIKKFTRKLEKNDSIIEYSIEVPATEEGLEYDIKYKYKDNSGKSWMEKDTGIKAKMVGEEVNGIDFTLDDEFNVVKELASKEFKVNPTASTILVNGEEIGFEGYLINNNNYFKLRDLAKVVKGTDKGFEVKWNNEKKSIELVSKEEYTEVGGELALGDKSVKTAIANTSSIYKDGEKLELESYTIDNNNYFKLRDIGKAFNIGITWDGERKTVGIDTTIDYILED